MKNYIFTERSLTRMSFLSNAILASPKQAVSFIRNCNSSKKSENKLMQSMQDNCNIPSEYREENNAYNDFLGALEYIFIKNNSNLDKCIGALLSSKDGNLAQFGKSLDFERQLNR